LEEIKLNILKTDLKLILPFSKFFLMHFFYILYVLARRSSILMRVNMVVYVLQWKTANNHLS